MRKKIVAGTVISLVAVLGLWLGVGGSASAHVPGKRVGSIRPAAGVASVSRGLMQTHAPRSSADTSDGDNVQSGDQNAPDTSASESESETSGEGDTSSETDNVDCQQEGDNEGVNTAGSGPGCDGSGQ